MTETLNVISVAAKDLRIAPENPRVAADEDGLKDLATNIEANGQLTPLIAYLEDDLYRVTAGSRRYRAMAILGWTNEPVKVAVYEKFEAVHFGVAEQLAHEKLSPIEEVQLFSQYEDASDKALANMIGKSLPYVRQHRKVLMLPEEVLDTFYTGGIAYEQALGLTYFIDHPNMLEDMFQRTKESDWYTLDRLRNEFTRAFGEWDRHPLSKLVTKAAYEKAGGRLEGDLFDETMLILDPDILKDIAHRKITAKLKKEYPDQAVVESDRFWSFDGHRGIDALTDAERARLKELDDTDTSDFEDDARDAHIAETEALEAKERHYPEDLLKLLVVPWAFNNSQRGYMSRSHCLPEDLTPLYEAGYLVPPAPEEGSPAAEEEKGPDMTAALVDRIQGIILHVNRQLLAQDPNEILTLYADSLEGLRDPLATFSFRPVERPAVTLHFDKAYEKLVIASEQPKVTPAGIRDRLAYNLLLRIDHCGGRPDASTIRKYFTPDADFLKAYGKEQLLDMLDEQARKEWASTKKGAIVAKVAEVMAADTSMLPPGF